MLARAALVRIAASVEIANLLIEIESSTIANFRPGARDQGVHVHGPDAPRKMWTSRRVWKIRLPS